MTERFNQGHYYLLFLLTFPYVEREKCFAFYCWQGNGQLNIFYFKNG